MLLNALLAISFVFMILVLVNPNKFGSYLGDDKRLKAFFIWCFIGVLLNPSDEINNIGAALGLLSLFWLVLSLKNPSGYANFVGNKWKRLKIIGVWFAILVALSIIFPHTKATNYNTNVSNTQIASDSQEEKIKPATTITEKQTTTEVKETEKKSSSKPKIKKVQYNYFSLSEKYLQEIYKATYQSQGMGIPEVDCRFMTYRDWDIIDGKIQVSEGTFYLAGNKNIEHTYTIRWRNKNAQVLYVIIDGQKIFYDEAAQDEAFND